MNKFITTTALFSLLILGACTAVNSNQVGVKVKNMGSGAGVQETELPTGWHFNGLGEDIILFPKNVFTETWATLENAGGPPISFTNKDGIQTNIALSILVRVDPSKASDLVQKYRLGFKEVVDGPVRRTIQDSFQRNGVNFSSEELMSGSAPKLTAAVWNDVKDRLSQEGVIIESINTVGPVGLPANIINRINDKVEAEQAAQAEQAKVATVQAQAQQRIAQAQGVAEALRIEGEAIRQNPEVIQLRTIQKWSGHCPLGANSCVVGSSVITQQ